MIHAEQPAARVCGRRDGPAERTVSHTACSCRVEAVELQPNELNIDHSPLHPARCQRRVSSTVGESNVVKGDTAGGGHLTASRS